MSSTKITLFLNSTKTLVLTSKDSVSEVNSNINETLNELAQEPIDFKKTFMFLSFDRNESVGIKLSELDAILITDTNIMNLKDVPSAQVKIEPKPNLVQKKVVKEIELPKRKIKIKPGPKPKNKLSVEKDAPDIDLDESEDTLPNIMSEDFDMTSIDSESENSFVIDANTFKLDEDFDPNELDIDESMEKAIQQERSRISSPVMSPQAPIVQQEDVKVLAKELLEKESADGSVVHKQISIEEMKKLGKKLA